MQILFFVLWQLPLYKISKKFGIDRSYYAFVPVASPFILAKTGRSSLWLALPTAIFQFGAVFGVFFQEFTEFALFDFETPFLGAFILLLSAIFNTIIWVKIIRMINKPAWMALFVTTLPHIASPLGYLAIAYGFGGYKETLAITLGLTALAMVAIGLITRFMLISSKEANQTGDLQSQT